MSFRDKTFCASPGCQNKCGRRMTAEEEWALGVVIASGGCPVSWGYFCGEPVIINIDGLDINLNPREVN